MQAVLRNQIDRPAEQLLQVLLQGEVRHPQVVARHPHIQQIDVAVRPGVAAGDRTEDRQLSDTVLAAQLGKAQR